MWFDFIHISTLLLIVALKAVVLRFTVCESSKALSANKNYLMWGVTLLPGLLEYLLLLPVSYLFSMFGAAMATQPLHISGNPQIDLFTSFTIGISFFTAWAMNLILVPCTVLVLKALNTTKPRGFLVSYFAVTAIEYLLLVIIHLITDPIRF
jgi:hypothetical protein